MVSVRVTAVCCWALLVVFVTSSPAEEQRCTGLGANCVCSEPFNTNNLVETQTFWKNPADSTTKQCSTAGIAGGSLEANPVSKIIPRNDAQLRNALPAGNSIQWAVGGTNGHLGIFFAGHTHSSATFTKRLAARFYIYHSTDYQFAQEGVCTNSKLMQFTGPNSLLDKSFGHIHMYNFLASDGWSPGQDCCFNGPGPDQGAIQKADWRGNWWRLEAVYINRAGPNWRFLLYAKNVTTNGPEYLIVDTAASGTQLVGGANMSPPGRQDAMAINNYRETGCNGWQAFSHYMMAGWDTDAGQRIGAAAEIEGGGGTTPPAVPTNLRVQ
ncbi:MAG: hypothetical protein L0214_14295 [candidate division NC10 bacterium]|nr:hypothetical protein [candidate division NC10 bacterium]